MKINAEEEIAIKDIVYMDKILIENFNGPNKMILRITFKNGSTKDIEHEPPFVDVFNLERKIFHKLTS